MLKTPLRYGSAIGFAQFLATLVVYLFGMHQSLEKFKSAQMVESLVGFTLLMVLVSFAHRAFRKESAGSTKPVPFSVSLKFATVLGVVSGFVAGLAQYAYFAFINTSLRELIHADTVTRMQPEIAKLPADAAAETLRKIDYFTSAGFRGLVYCVNTVLFTVLLSIAFSLVFQASIKRDNALKKKDA